MKRKALVQTSISILVFLGLWIGLAQVNWKQIFKVAEVTDSLQDELGKLLWNSIQKTEVEVLDVTITKPLDSIVAHLCTTNGMDKSKIKLHVFDNQMINAFAMPDGHLIVYTGLIKHVTDQDELTGVIAHEIAHLELGHIMKKLVKEIGLSTLLTLVSGNGNLVVVKEISKVLSSSAYDRSLEKEADIKAVDYLITAGVNPNALGDFLYDISGNDDHTDFLGWFSTHPDSKERATYIISYARDKISTTKSVLSPETWDKVKEEVENLNDSL